MGSTDLRDGAPEAVLRRLITEGFSEGRLEVADELVSDECIEHQNFGPGHAPGAEGVRAVIRSLRAAFPDFQLVVQDEQLNPTATVKAVRDLNSQNVNLLFQRIRTSLKVVDLVQHGAIAEAAE